MRRGDHVRSTEGHLSGVALWYIRTEGDTAIVIAVGDDTEREVDADSLTALTEGDFCGSCGQIGCGHG